MKPKKDAFGAMATRWFLFWTSALAMVFPLEAVPVLADIAAVGDAAQTTESGAPGPVPPSCSFYPPLCIEDAIELTSRSLSLLASPADSNDERRRAEARRMLQSAADYCRLLDNRHSTLWAYDWTRLTTLDVPEKGVAVDSYVLPTPMKHVSAISFSASKGDAWIRDLEVTDNNGVTTHYEIDRWVGKDLPRTTVCYLQRRTKVAVIRTRRSGRGEPARLRIFAGVTNEPEYAKTAILQIEQGLIQMEQGAWDGASKCLERAIRYMKSFDDYVRFGIDSHPKDEPPQPKPASLVDGENISTEVGTTSIRNPAPAGRERGDGHVFTTP